MTRLTILSFLLLSGFFYMTGQPVNETADPENSAANLTSRSAKSVFHPANTVEKLQEVRLAPSSMTINQDDSGNLNTAAVPVLPVRNPKRQIKDSAALTVAQLDKKQQLNVTAEKKSLADTKPLFTSYQQRYTAPQKPVIGPRVMAALMKKELRRVGCYSGNITTNWDESARNAVARFNADGGFDLTTEKPDVASYEKLQQITQPVCKKEPDTGRTILAATSAQRLNAIKRTSNNKWRTKIKQRKSTVAYNPATSFGDADRPAVKRKLPKKYAKPKRKARRKVAKRSQRRSRKRARIAQRKVKRRTAVRGWKKKYRRKKFGFSSRSGSFKLNF